MKTFFVLLVDLVAFNYALAQVDSPESNRVNAEAESYIDQIQNMAGSEESFFRYEILAEAYKFYAEVTNMINNLGPKFGTFGSKGKTAQGHLERDLEDIINAMRLLFTPDPLEALLQITLNSFRMMTIDDRENELEDLKADINVDVGLVDCWDSNKDSIKGISDKLIAEAKLLVDDQVNYLKSQIITSTSHVKSEWTVAVNDLNECNGDVVCGVEYVSSIFQTTNILLDTSLTKQFHRSRKTT